MINEATSAGGCRPPDRHL